MFLRVGLACLIYLAALLETAPQLADFAGITIGWLMLVTVIVVWNLAPAEAAAWGAAIGLTIDAVGAGPMGLHLAAVSALTYVGAALRDRWECRTLLAFTLFAIALTGGVLSIASIGEWGVAATSRPGTPPYLLITGCAVATGLCATILALLWRTGKLLLLQVVTGHRA